MLIHLRLIGTLGEAVKLRQLLLLQRFFEAAPRNVLFKCGDFGEGHESAVRHLMATIVHLLLDHEVEGPILRGNLVRGGLELSGGSVDDLKHVVLCFRLWGRPWFWLYRLRVVTAEQRMG